MNASYVRPPPASAAPTACGASAVTAFG